MEAKATASSQSESNEQLSRINSNEMDKRIILYKVSYFRYKYWLCNSLCNNRFVWYTEKDNTYTNDNFWLILFILVEYPNQILPNVQLQNKPGNPLSINNT